MESVNKVDLVLQQIAEMARTPPSSSTKVNTLLHDMRSRVAATSAAESQIKDLTTRAEKAEESARKAELKIAELQNEMRLSKDQPKENETETMAAFSGKIRNLEDLLKETRNDLKAMTTRALVAEDQLQRTSALDQSNDSQHHQRLMREASLEAQLKEVQTALALMTTMRNEAEARAATAEIEALEYSTQLSIARRRIMDAENAALRSISPISFRAMERELADSKSEIENLRQIINGLKANNESAELMGLRRELEEMRLQREHDGETIAYYQMRVQRRKQRKQMKQAKELGISTGGEEGDGGTPKSMVPPLPLDKIAGNDPQQVSAAQRSKQPSITLPVSGLFDTTVSSSSNNNNNFALNHVSSNSSPNDDNKSTASASSHRTQHQLQNIQLQQQLQQQIQQSQQQQQQPYASSMLGYSTHRSWNSQTPLVTARTISSIPETSYPIPMTLSSSSGYPIVTKDISFVALNENNDIINDSTDDLHVSVFAPGSFIPFPKDKPTPAPAAAASSSSALYPAKALSSSGIATSSTTTNAAAPPLPSDSLNYSLSSVKKQQDSIDLDVHMKQLKRVNAQKNYEVYCMVEVDAHIVRTRPFVFPSSAIKFQNEAFRIAIARQTPYLKVEIKIQGTNERLGVSNNVPLSRVYQSGHDDMWVDILDPATSLTFAQLLLHLVIEHDDLVGHKHGVAPSNDYLLPFESNAANSQPIAANTTYTTTTAAITATASKNSPPVPALLSSSISKDSSGNNSNHNVLNVINSSNNSNHNTSNSNINNIINSSLELPNREALHDDQLLPNESAFLNNDNLNSSQVTTQTLMKAVSNGDVAVMKDLLSHANAETINTPDSTMDGNTVLHHAVSCGSLDMVSLLIDHAADVNASNSDNETPLHFSVKFNYPNIAELLVRSGGSLDAKTRVGLTSLHHAAKVGNVQMAQVLLRLRADPISQTEDRGVPLHYAAHNGHTSVVSLLVALSTPNHSDKYNMTPLHYSVRNGHYESSLALLNARADPNICSTSMSSPLLTGCDGGSFKIVQMLLEFKANPMHRDKKGWSALHYCALRGSVACANELFKYLPTDAEEFTTNNTETPLHVACKSNKAELVQLLLSRDSNSNALDVAGKTPLHYAAGLPSQTIVSLLMNAKADPNIADENGILPINHARTTDNVMVINMLSSQPVS